MISQVADDFPMNSDIIATPQKMPKSGSDHQFSKFYHTCRTIIYHNSPYLTIIYHKLSLHPFIYSHEFIIFVRDFANFYFWGTGSGHSATKWFIASAFWAGCQGHPGVPALEIDGGKLDERFHTQKLPKCPWHLFLGEVISVLAIRLHHPKKKDSWIDVIHSHQPFLLWLMKPPNVWGPLGLGY